MRKSKDVEYLFCLVAENQRRRRVKVFRCSFAILRTTIKIPGVVIVLKSSLEGERFVGGGTSGSQEFSIKLL
jgi:hypothetical protein